MATLPFIFLPVSTAVVVLLQASAYCNNGNFSTFGRICETMNEIEWNACIRCNENEVGGSFSVLIFIGAVPDDPMQWMKSTSCVGVHDVFAGYGESRDEAEVEGFVDLKEGLKKARIGSLTPDVVVPFLKDELHWRVQNVGLFSILNVIC